MTAPTIVDHIAVTVRVEVNGEVHEISRSARPENTFPAVLPFLADILLRDTGNEASAWLSALHAEVDAALRPARANCDVVTEGDGRHFEELS